MKTKEYRAAGGVVLDLTGRVLLIVRDVERGGESVHEVRLPKGHVDEGETDEQAAVREVCEEAGCLPPRVIADLGELRSEYDFRDRHYIRDEHFFLMHLHDTQLHEPDVDPDSEEALFKSQWARNLVEAELQLTYETEKEFARRAQNYTATLRRQQQQQQQQQQ